MVLREGVLLPHPLPHKDSISAQNPFSLHSLTDKLLNTTAVSTQEFTNENGVSLNARRRSKKSPEPIGFVS